MKTPTPEQIAKLPAWAKEHIENLERQRDVSVRALNEFQDASTPSAFYIENLVCTGENVGPSEKRAYIQSRKVHVEWRGVQLSIQASDYGVGPGINLQWTGLEDVSSEVAFIPTSYQSARIVTKEDMR